ncbi:MAG TPA: WecB/TagA/CpsF family glycosyltransferase [Herpetosiphonaceae bacterium]|nr:WecB/TagA/CpsF family glycosyltransferase [Herpetosiphonaceae bacterium]
MIDKGKKNIIGVLIDAVDYEAATERIIAAARAGRPLAVSALAVHGVMTGFQDSEHRGRLNRMDLVVPDGQPVRWALDLLHRTDLPDRVYGPNLTLNVCREAEQEGLSIYLYGSTEAVLTRLVESLRRQFPRLSIAGAQPSKFRRLTGPEKAEVVADIKASGAHITLVGLGCPRQEVWAYEYREALSMPILAVGAAFDFHSGMKKQAPRWMQDHGLEWVFRLMSEPRRLWRRYLLLNPWYMALVAAQRLGLRRFPVMQDAPTTVISYG